VVTPGSLDGLRHAQADAGELVVDVALKVVRGRLARAVEQAAAPIHDAHGDESGYSKSDDLEKHDVPACW